MCGGARVRIYIRSFNRRARADVRKSAFMFMNGRVVVTAVRCTYARKVISMTQPVSLVALARYITLPGNVEPPPRPLPPPPPPPAAFPTSFPHFSPYLHLSSFISPAPFFRNLRVRHFQRIVSEKPDPPDHPSNFPPTSISIFPNFPP